MKYNDRYFVIFAILIVIATHLIMALSSPVFYDELSDGFLRGAASILDLVGIQCKTKQTPLMSFFLAPILLFADLPVNMAYKIVNHTMAILCGVFVYFIITTITGSRIIGGIFLLLSSFCLSFIAYANGVRVEYVYAFMLTLSLLYLLKFVLSSQFKYFCFSFGSICLAILARPEALLLALFICMILLIKLVMTFLLDNKIIPTTKGFLSSIAVKIDFQSNWNLKTLISICIVLPLICIAMWCSYQYKRGVGFKLVSYTGSAIWLGTVVESNILAIGKPNFDKCIKAYCKSYPKRTICVKYPELLSGKVSIKTIPPNQIRSISHGRVNRSLRRQGYTNQQTEQIMSAASKEAILSNPFTAIYKWMHRCFLVIFKPKYKRDIRYATMAFTKIGMAFDELFDVRKYHSKRGYHKRKFIKGNSGKQYFDLIYKDKQATPYDIKYSEIMIVLVGLIDSIPVYLSVILLVIGIFYSFNKYSKLIVSVYLCFIALGIMVPMILAAPLYRHNIEFELHILFIKVLGLLGIVNVISWVIQKFKKQLT